VSHSSRHLNFLLLVAAIAATLAMVAALQLTKSAAAQETVGVSVEIEPTAKLLKDGAVLVRVQVTCPKGMEVLEAHVSVSQDDQTVFGQSGIPVKCTGKAHTYRTAVTAQQGQFHTGSASSSAFVLILDPATGTTQSGGDTEPSLEVR
jgi:hypothetical protein